MNLERAIRAITDLVVRCEDPDEVVLFGSHAKGTARPDSDVDLLIVAPYTVAPRARGRELRGLLERYPFPFDLHCVTREEIDRARSDSSSWLATSLSSGRRLYARLTLR